MKKCCLIQKRMFSLLMLAGLAILEITPVSELSAAAAPKLNKTSITLTVGNKYKLVLKNYKKSTKWNSSKKKVASVSKNGLVKAKKQGISVISTKIGKKKYSCRVKVSQNKLTTKYPTTILPTTLKSIVAPTVIPTAFVPTTTLRPTVTPTEPYATKVPSVDSTSTPALSTKAPVEIATATPITPTKVPIYETTATPTRIPSDGSTAAPTKVPTDSATAIPTRVPADGPTTAPTETSIPGVTAAPTVEPTAIPSNVIKYYNSDEINIVITEKRVHDTDYFVADIQISSLDYFRTALARNQYGVNITQRTSSMAKAHNAIFAINGDYYGYKYRTGGYVIRNGKLYRSSLGDDGTDVLVADKYGALSVFDQSEITAEKLDELGTWQAWSFGPGLISDGTILVGDNDEVASALKYNPRAALGMISPLHYIAFVSDGRTTQSKGLSLKEVAVAMLEEGCKVAYNLDGGGSATMWFNGELINHPTDGTNNFERSISDCIYFGLE